MKCPHCKKEINIGSMAATSRWKKVSKPDRKKAMQELAKKRWNKLSPG